jgi:hypothetical protein
VQHQLARLVEVRERVLDVTHDDPQLRHGAVRRHQGLHVQGQRHPDRLDDAEDPGGLSGGGPGLQEQRPGALQQGPPLRDHDTADGGEPHPGGVPVEQGHADLGFQPVQPPARRASRMLTRDRFDVRER